MYSLYNQCCDNFNHSIINFFLLGFFMVLRGFFSPELIRKSVFSGFLVVKFYAYCCTEYVNIFIQALLISQRELQHLHRVFISLFVHTSSLACAVLKTITNLPSLVITWISALTRFQKAGDVNIPIPKVSKGSSSRPRKEYWMAICTREPGTCPWSVQKE